MPEAAGEYSMARTYLEWLTELPWSVESGTPIDIAEARRTLDADHYGLAKVKRRILEYLAIHKLNPGGRSPILCFVGPPGVGKTSLGQSIARATGRKFVRVSLGGVHDEAEIRGHRRTYIGALPGNIIQSIRRAGTRDCVMMLDEVDKLGHGIQGDPASALLEVLDPEQNGTFRDNYLGVPFDLSRVMFITTANVLDTVPGPLRDRMEIIDLPGYVEDEKLEIARRYLVDRQLAANGLRAEQAEIGEAALRAIIRDYTREAGVRQLEREIGAVLRNVAMRIAEASAQQVRIEPGDLPEILGPPRFESEVAMRTSIPGVATGLAWTPVGGDILFIEATRTPGGNRLILTGQLGEVMSESAQAALTLVKARASRLDLDPAMFEKSDIHIHVPAGAIPKDGPSAGVAMYTALVSLLTNRTVRSDTAMTGEISLRGLVLPVGGIKEKVTRRRARRARRGDPAGAQPPRLRRDPRERARQPALHLGRADRGRHRSRPRTGARLARPRRVGRVQPAAPAATDGGLRVTRAAPGSKPDQSRSSQLAGGWQAAPPPMRLRRRLRADPGRASAALRNERRAEKRSAFRHSGSSGIMPACRIIAATGSLAEPSSSRSTCATGVRTCWWPKSTCCAARSAARAPAPLSASMPGLSCPIICIACGSCRRTMPTSPAGGARSRSRS